MPPSPKLSAQLVKLIVCPVTKQPLRYDEENNELISDAAGLAYPVVDGIPMLLVEEARTLKGSRGANAKSVASKEMAD